MKAKILYFDNHDVCRILTRKIKEGKVVIDGGEHYVSNIREPILIEMGRIFKKPFKLFFVHHRDGSQALQYDINDEMFKTAISPKNMKEIAKQGAIRQLLSVGKTRTMDMLMYIAIGGIMGIMAGIIVAPMLAL